MKTKSPTLNDSPSNSPAIYTLLCLFAIILLAVVVAATSISISKVNNLPLVQSPVDAPVKHNMLVVIMDDVGVDQIGVYNEGPSPANTPVIDQLAAEGVLFRNAYSNPLCTPTRAGVQTGRYGFRTGIGHVYELNESGYSLTYSELTLPEMLDVGTNGNYAHALFGKWHLANQSNGGALSPNLAGYSHYSGLLGNVSIVESYFNWKKTVNGVSSNKTGYLTTDTVDDAIAWTGAQTKPWLAVVAFNAPHAPFHNPPANLHTVDLTNPTDLKKYHAALEALDTELGRLIQHLKQTGQYANTTIIVIGDNGTQGSLINASGVSKGSVYEGGINVPFIVVSPFVKVKGVESAAFVQTLDVFATLADIAQVNVSQVAPGVKIDSISLLPYLKNASTRSLRAYGFSEKFDPVGVGYGAMSPPPGVTLSIKAMRDVRYKLHVDVVAQTEEFYDLLVDPLESQNLLVNGLAPGSPEELAYTKLKADMVALVSS